MLGDLGYSDSALLRGQNVSVGPESIMKYRGEEEVLTHPAAADRSVVVERRAAGRGVVVGGGGSNQRPLGFLLGAVGVVVFDDVVLPAEESDDGWGAQRAGGVKTRVKGSDVQNSHLGRLTRPQQQHRGDDEQLSRLQVRSHPQTLHRRLVCGPTPRQSRVFTKTSNNQHIEPGADL